VTSFARREPIERFLRRSAAQRFYGDGPPHWRLGRSNVPATTAAEADAQRRKLVKKLRQHGTRKHHVLELANLIASCRPRARCASGACPECMRAAQRLFVAAAADLLRRSSTRVLALSGVWRLGGVREGDLGDGSRLFAPLSGRLRQAMNVSGMAQAFGGFDVSANEHALSRFDPHYRPHAWIFIPERSFRRAESEFREFFPTSATVRRPVVAKRFDGKRRGLAYALKSKFQRRVTLPRKVGPDGEVKRRNSRDRPLRARQEVELSLALHQLGPDARLFLHGLQMVESSDGLRLVARKANGRAERRRDRRIRERGRNSERR
jgi:hypothetical protein